MPKKTQLPSASVMYQSIRNFYESHPGDHYPSDVAKELNFPADLTRDTCELLVEEELLEPAVEVSFRKRHA